MKKKPSKAAAIKATELYRCDLCGRTSRLAVAEPHWCSCTPSNPFRLVPVRITTLVDGLLGRRR
jgi:hypothetical protein